MATPNNTKTLYDAGGDGHCGPKSILASLKYFILTHEGFVDDETCKDILMLDHERFREMIEGQGGDNWWTDVIIEKIPLILESKFGIKLSIRVFSSIGEHGCQVFGNSSHYLDIAGGGYQQPHFVCMFDHELSDNYIQQLGLTRRSESLEQFVEESNVRPWYRFQNQPESSNEQTTFQKLQKEIVKWNLLKKNVDKVLLESNLQISLKGVDSIPTLQNFVIGFRGTRGAGKSSIINALLGANYLPTSAIGTCTPFPFYITYGEQISETIFYHTEDQWKKIESLIQNSDNVDANSILNDSSSIEFGTSKTIHYNSFEEWENHKAGDEGYDLSSIGTNKKKLFSIEKIYLQVPAKILQHGICIIDTPGTEDGSIFYNIHNLCLKDSHLIVIPVKLDNLGQNSTYQMLKHNMSGTKNDKVVTIIREIQLTQKEMARMKYDPQNPQNYIKERLNMEPPTTFDCTSVRDNVIKEYILRQADTFFDEKLTQHLDFVRYFEECLKNLSSSNPYSEANNCVKEFFKTQVLRDIKSALDSIHTKIQISEVKEQFSLFKTNCRDVQSYQRVRSLLTGTRNRSPYLSQCLLTPIQRSIEDLALNLPKLENICSNEEKLISSFYNQQLNLKKILQQYATTIGISLSSILINDFHTIDSDASGKGYWNNVLNMIDNFDVDDWIKRVCQSLSLCNDDFITTLEGLLETCNQRAKESIVQPFTELIDGKISSILNPTALVQISQQYEPLKIGQLINLTTAYNESIENIAKTYNLPILQIPNSISCFSKGHIYLLENPCFLPDVFKIGYTSRSVEERKKDLFTTGVPEPFNTVKTWEVVSVAKCEAFLHELLANFRVNKRREFFKGSKGIFIEIIDHIVRLFNQYVVDINQ